MCSTKSINQQTKSNLCCLKITYAIAISKKYTRKACVKLISDSLLWENCTVWSFPYVRRTCN